jgi:1,5-anhydro-D-fructose reductase (1,5-anhydro-D-mannitol-forming)
LIRFGIVGFGLHAVKRLMPGFEKSKHCRVSALSRRDLVRAKESARQHNIPLAFASVAELCKSSDVDAVLVTTPNSMHLQDVLTAIDSGKAVLCEKPMAMNADECRRMVKAARKKKVLLGIAHVFRFEESIREIRQLVADGKVGRPIFARSEFSFFADPFHPRKWLHDASLAGAGPIFDIGVHCIDSLRFILQDEVERVSATAARDDRSGNVEASAGLTLEFARGTIATVLVSFRAQYRTPIEFIGETGVIRADNALTVDRPVELQLVRDGTTVESKSVSNHLAYAMQVDAFADAAEGKSEFSVPGEEGWRNQEVLDAALRSIRSGKADTVAKITA